MTSREVLTQTSPPQTFVEPLSMAEAKEFCEIPEADGTRDFLVSALITAAREVAELRQGRDLVTKQWDLTFNRFCREVQLRENVATIDLFRYRDSDGTYHTLVEGTDYILDTSAFLAVPPYGITWPSYTPWPSSSVLLRYTVVPPAIDTQVLLGMRFLISQWYVNRIPAELGASNVQQYPFALGLLDHGRVERV